MNIPRRQVLTLGAASLAAACLAGCESLEQRLTRIKLPANSLPRAGAPDNPAVRLLNRVAYGPCPGDIAAVQAIGIDRYVEEQLFPERMDESPAAVWRVRGLEDSLQTDTGLLFDEDDRRLVAALRQSTLLRAVYSRRQLYERMAEFWNDHFNIYAFKGQGPQLKIIDDQQTIRRHALGRFPDLLAASARSAAMLGYLDNNANRKGIPNENYARELMELHTLGIHGGYTQQDVKEVARCLTGWTSEKHWHRGRFLFDPAAHDNGAKQVLGMAILPGGGVTDGERVLALLARHPATAQHLSRKLCVHFLGHAPDPWVARLSQIYLQTEGDIKSMLRPLLTSPDLLNAPRILKRPYDYVVSSLRALNADTDGGAAIQTHLEQMGQPLFGWPMPNGYPEQPEYWTGALLARWNFALALAGGALNNTTVNWSELTDAGRRAGLDADHTLQEFVFGGKRDMAISQKENLEPAEYAALLLMSPDFQWR